MVITRNRIGTAHHVFALLLLVVSLFLSDGESTCTGLISKSVWDNISPGESDDKKLKIFSENSVIKIFHI